jgi:glycosyltransferase involved in cell wall biosynthesis
MRQARMNVFTTPGAARTYRERYPHWSNSIQVLENGYDEATFAAAERRPGRDQPLNPGALTLLHSGIVYPSERNPEPLFRAVAAVLAAGRLAPQSIRLRFRAAVHEALLRSLADAHAIGHVIEILPALPYQEALQEMLRADALLLMQSNTCNDQVPAKLYEYLRAGRPVLCLADAAGDTAGACRAAGLHDIAALEDSDAITATLVSFIDALQHGRAAPAQAEAIRGASRQARSAQLAAWLDAVSAASSGGT